MNIIRYQPAALMREFQQELFPLLSWLKEPSFLSSELTAWTPTADIKEEPARFVVYLDVPGINPEEIDIEIEDKTLIIKGERKAEKEEAQKDYYRLERLSGKFCRQFTLPELVDRDKITAKVKQGVLEISVPKAQKDQHLRKITVVADE